MTAPSLTRNMRDLMRVIQEYHACYGVPPSFAEIASEMDWASNSSVASTVDGLVARGYLGRIPGHARTLTVLIPVPPAEDVEFVGLFDAPAAEASRGAP